MRAIVTLAVLSLLASPALAADEPVDGEEQLPATPRACTPAQAVVPPFNNTPEAMEQSQVAATVLQGDEICRTSPVFPEKSAIEHGEEQPALPEEAAVEPVEEPAPAKPA
ncbi:MAG: hypothetical protein R3E14_00185 [Erythrobacter sp.]